MLLSVLLGILVGTILGLTGAGGGILAVPALIAGMGWTVQQAAPVALIAVVSSSIIGAIEGLRKKIVRYRAAMLIAATGVPSTALGIKAAQLIPHAWLMALFGLIMLIVAQRLITPKNTGKVALLTNHLEGVGQINPYTGRFDWNPATAILMAAIGLFTGFMTGLLGVGGGFFIVPMLKKFTNLTMHAIVPTSLLIIALVGTGGIVTALLQGAHMPLLGTGMFTITMAMGMLIGRQLTQHLSEKTIQRGFATVLAIVAIGLEVKAVLEIYAG